MNRVSALVAPHSRTTDSRLTPSKYSSNLARSWPPSAFPNLLDHGLQVHVQTRSITASECISKFTGSRCGETVELERRHPIIDIPPHLAWYLKGIRDKERLLLEERRKRVRGYEGIPGHDEPHKWHGSMNAWQQCVKNHTNCVDQRKLGNSAWRPRAGKDRVCISYNDMMSIYPGVSQIYTRCHSVRLRYPGISVPILPPPPCQTEWWWWETDFSVTTASKCISKFSQLESPGAIPITLEYRRQPDWPYVYI